MSKIDEIVHKALEIGTAAQAIRNAVTPEALKDVEDRISLLRHSLEKQLER